MLMNRADARKRQRLDGVIGVTGLPSGCVTHRPVWLVHPEVFASGGLTRFPFSLAAWISPR